MSRTPKKHFNDLPLHLSAYAASRLLDFKNRKGQHFSVIDQDFTRIDVWLTGKYHVIYNKTWRITNSLKVLPRSGERGMLPTQKLELGRFLDRLFYLADVIESVDK